VRKAEKKLKKGKFIIHAFGRGGKTKHCTAHTVPRKKSSERGGNGKSTKKKHGHQG